MFRATILTLYPEMFPGPLGLSLSGDGLARGLWSLEALNIREHGLGRHRTVDDTPAGGGAGMVLRADVLAAAIDAASPADDARPRLLMSPRGKPLTQARVRELAAGPGALIVCGRFEGVDERVIEGRGLEEVSIGDYVLSGGEIAALTLLDACVRLIPGVMGKEASGEEESFENGLLEYPHYTRPREWEGREIPEILLSGDHGKIGKWRRAEAERITQERRPDIWRDAGFPTEAHKLDAEQIELFNQIPGGSALMRFMRDAPTFGDAEIVSLTLVRDGASAIRLSIPGRRKAMLATFALGGWIDVTLAGFSHQNVLGGLKLRRATTRELKDWDVGVGVEAGDTILELAPCFGAFGSIRARILRIMLDDAAAD